MPFIKSIAAMLFFALCATTGSARAEVIDVQFSGNFTIGSRSGPYAPRQTGAALIGAPGDAWNYFTVSSATGQALVDATGAATGASLTFTSNRAYTAQTSYDAFAGTPTQDLMLGYLVENISMTLSGFSPNEAYRMYVYTQGDDNSAGRLIQLSATGAGTQSSTQTNASTYILNNNYLLFQGHADALGDIQLTQLGSIGEGDLNGFQLVAPGPAPGAGLLSLFALGGIAFRLRGARLAPGRG